MEEVDYDLIRENLKKEGSYSETYTEKTAKKPKKSKKLVVLAAAIALLALFAFALIRPAVIGYSVYGNVKKSGLATDDYTLNVESLNNRLNEAENSLISCNDQKTQVETELSAKNSEIGSIAEDLSKMQNELDEKNEEIEKLSEKNIEINAELDEEKNNYLELLKNSARTICCKEKVDNENINFYAVDDGKITCSEESGEELKCW